jgi:hypothetical protein
MLNPICSLINKYGEGEDGNFLATTQSSIDEYSSTSNNNTTMRSHRYFSIRARASYIYLSQTSKLYVKKEQ